MVEVAPWEWPCCGEGGEMLRKVRQGDGAGSGAELLEVRRQSLEMLRLHRLGYPDHVVGWCRQAAGMWISTPSTTSWSITATTT